MAQRIERQPAGLSRGVVAQRQRRVAMRRLVQGDRQDRRDHRQRELENDVGHASSRSRSAASARRVQRQRRRAASARAAARRAVGGRRSAAGSCRSKSAVGREIAAAIQGDVAAGRQRLRAPDRPGAPDSAFIARSSVTRTPSKPIRAADDRLDHGRGQRRRQCRRPRRDRRCAPTWPRAGRRSRRTAEDRQPGRSPRRVAAKVAVDARATVARRVLAHRLHAGGEQARGQRTSQARHGGGRLRARLDRRSPRARPERPDPAPVRPPRRSPAAAQSRPISAPVSQAARSPARALGRRWMRPPMRRTQARDAPALLIHHQQRASRQDPAEVGDQRGKLLRALDVACEQDDAARWIGAKQRSLLGCQRQSANPDDGGLQKSATEQSSPLARSRSQNEVACAESEKPPVRTRHNEWPSRSTLLKVGLCAPSRSGTRLDNRSHSDLAASSECTAASWTSAPFAAGAATGASPVRQRVLRRPA